ncbi:MAG: hypothetical protein AAF657_17645 [Acidobacteriota bacterium]
MPTKCLIIASVACILLQGCQSIQDEPLDPAPADPPPAETVPPVADAGDQADAGPGANAAFGVVCAISGSQGHPTRVPDRSPVGQPTSVSLCQTFVRNAKEGAVCTRNGRNFQPFRLRDLGPVGVGMSSDDCVRVMAAARSGVVCAGAGGGRFFPTVIDTGAPIGSPTDLTTCLQSV